MNRRIVWFVVAAAVVAAVVGVALAGTLGTDPTAVESPLIGKPAPPLVLDDLAGDGTVRLSDHLGDVVVVNFWSSSCLSCRAEHEDVARAAAQYAGEDVTFFGVDIWDTRGDAREYLDRYGWIPGSVYGIDEGSAATFAYGVTGTPETFFVDSDGVIVEKVIGPVTSELLTETVDRIRSGDDATPATTGAAGGG